MGGKWANKLGNRGDCFSCFSASVCDVQALLFLCGTDDNGFDEPTGPDPLLECDNRALDALVFAVETRELAAELITDSQPSSSS